MDVGDWIAFGVFVALLLTFWIVQVVQKNGIIRDQAKALETFADLNPELRKEFGERNWMDSVEGDGEIQLYRVLDYLKAKETTQASQEATSLVEHVEKRFKK